MGKYVWKVYFAGTALTCMLLFQNCSPGFQVDSVNLSSLRGEGLSNAPSVVRVEQGKLLYSNNCSVCHGELTRSNKREKSPYQINSAINGLSYMSHLKSLSGDQIAMISDALGYDASRPAGQCKGTRDADMTALHRMNKAEYVNTIGDLFNLPASVAVDFPEDNDGELFANNASALARVSTDLMEQYFLASEKIVAGIWSSNKSLVMTCSPPQTAAAACASSILDGWGLRILRRPLHAAERTQLLTMVNTTSAVSAAEFETGIQTALKALLVSPDFIYRAVASKTGVIKELNDYELATRLAYFIWSSTVDMELLNTAKAGTLKQPEVLRAQIRRMLASPKAKRMTLTFASRWLGLKRLAQREPDKSVYPNFTPTLKTALETETTLFFDNLISRDLSLKEVLTADYSFLNGELAAHYGIGGVTGTDFRQISLATTPRRGVVSHGSVLLLTSHPDDSSIVARGKWVLDRLMCDPPPPPPDVIPTNPGANDPNLTKRQKLEAHRNNANCFSCHAKMDPIGFGLENFDGIGGWRTTLAGKPVDTAGKLPDGKSFTNATELIKYLDESQIYNKCVSENLMSYAVGRVLEEKDECNVEEVAVNGIGNNKSLSETIEAIVRSSLFSKVQGR